ncbi:MAG TPA: DCC1-like thiol-disulfide oxidoreductase family protein [Solirubrobacteraceae bacterium]|nr:DCC1-like thiol-disulfide oxidoreductase family protein [Solirubrobacteraceae bacterium]
MAAETGAWTVLYDGECGVCEWLLSLLLRWDRGERLRPLALQRPEATRLLAGLTRQQQLASWHLISPDGSRRSAGAALAPVLRLLPGGRLPAAVLTGMPAAAEVGYRWVADHRAQLSRLVPSQSKQRAAGRVRLRESAPRH